MFVRSNGGQYVSLGIGKQIDRKGSLCAVEYFDSPTSETIVHNIESRLIERITIAKQARVYCFDSRTATWEIGHLLDDSGDSQLIQFPENKSRRLRCESVFVRWDLPIKDPTSFLANRISESPRFAEGRSAFVRSQTHQRAASKGMSALLACAVELEPHQIEVVRRILQDPVQRYLLADEVGLGKTIEAGVLIRQCVLDMKGNCTVLVAVPAPLISQWRAELSSKFLLERHLDRGIHVISHDEDDQIRTLLPKATMLVIDEAHQLIDLGIANETSVYQDIARVAPILERVLLLSATPALHNERGFMRMLHLLDPPTYPLDGEDAFRRKVENRQALAEIVAGLTPQNVLFLDHAIDQLRRLFPEDELLREHLEKLGTIVETMPDESDPALMETINQLHDHLSEVYRLHRRILRHRRRDISGLTPDRSGAEIVRYRSSDRAALTSALEDWRFGESTKLDEADREALWKKRARTFWLVLDRGSQYPSSGAGLVSLLAQQTGIVSDASRFAAVRRCLGRPGLFEDRADALIEALQPFVSSGSKCIVFCSDTKSADLLAKRIARRLGIVVDRHDPTSEAWTAFNNSADRSVLVCDRRAEEGLNLQGGKKVVVHYDLPFNPNRMEQRLGRADRYGSDHAVRSVVLACEDDPFEMAWVEYLDSALKVFDRSVAGLQYLLEKTMGGFALPLFVEGAEGIIDLTAESNGEHGKIEREISAIDQQYALDALGAPPVTLFDDLAAVEENWLAMAGDTTTWLEQTLQFGRLDEPRLAPSSEAATPFRYIYSTIPGRHTLVPMQTFVANCGSALDLGPRRQGDTTIRTMPYTFRRRTALHPRARANGVGLLRYGDDLISGISAFTESDDRGRCFAMWRFAPDHSGDPVADIYFRFDFVLEADGTAAACVLADHGRDTGAARAAIRRRSDMALPPFYRSIWLDRELAPVKDEALLARLGHPYNVEPDRSGAVDLNLTARRWQRLLQMKLPELAYWGELCGKARAMAEEVLRVNSEVVTSLGESEQRAARVDRGRLGQLRARARAGATEAESAEFAFEEQLAAAVRAGINAPRVQLDTIGAVFISASRTATDRISGGM
ncbi:protein DpdE [Rhizobium sp. WYCCWR 11128]|uniref:protein DpdE n=1 Tax=Rhizobium sp. WYCCWR 11128 TaxID=2749832 RepID=UPI0015D24F03|nr:protein DpdE [Rhizobium sp. WYCCWR 11128]NYT32076.1 DEAD/DEAH box helicase [Rhizobium sp. WYCCWR 11128]